MTEADFYIKEGNVRPALETKLIGQDGDPVDLTGSSVRFQMKEVGGDSTLVDNDANIVDATEAIVSYVWERGDTDDPGTYIAEFQVDYDGSTTFEVDEEFPNSEYITIEIEETIGDTS